MIKVLVIVTLVGFGVASTVKNETNKVVVENRVIGGEDISIEKVPYQVSIFLEHPHNHKRQHYCGGSIIAVDWVLTAAHCATQPLTIYHVRAGSSETDIGGSVHEVSRIVSHENYSMSDVGVPSNDIALFKMKTPFTMDSTRGVIKLYKSGEQTEAGTYSVVTGWGTISPNAIVAPRFLQMTSLPIISRTECENAYRTLTKFNPGQICAAYPEGGKDACQGDSGGPLVVGKRLAGIVSWGNGCAVAGRPGVYAEVAYYRDWIDRVRNRALPLTVTASHGTIALIMAAQMAVALASSSR